MPSPDACPHFLGWLKPEINRARGSAQNVVVSCSGCREHWQGGTAIAMVLDALKRDQLAQRLERARFVNTVKGQLEDAAFMEQLLREHPGGDVLAAAAYRQTRKLQELVQKLHDQTTKIRTALEEIRDQSTEVPPP